jgi:hypothetical protein
VVAPAQIYGPLIRTGEQRPSGARDGPACRLHARARPVEALHGRLLLVENKTPGVAPETVVRRVVAG